MSHDHAALKALFDKFDADKDGHITKDELTALAKDIGAGASDAEVAEVHAMFGNPDKLSYDDFVKHHEEIERFM